MLIRVVSLALIVLALYKIVHTILFRRTYYIATPRVSKCSLGGLTTSQQIPTIIHQSWKTEQVPPRFVGWQKSWLDLHPAWKYILWTDAQNLDLVKKHFPWFLARYLSFKENIKRVDSVRYMYMFKFGGFYADLDVECLADHTPLTYCGGVIVPLMSDPNEFLTDLDRHNSPNAWIGSIPGHPFWLFLLGEIMVHPETTAEYTTGPVALHDALQKYDSAIYDPENLFGGIRYTEPGLVFPYDWRHLDKKCYAHASNIVRDEAACKAKFNLSNSYAITYWSHSWEENPWWTS